MNNTKQIRGAKGESVAQNYLKENGYSIIETNFKCHFGEVDIIASKDNELTFVEVKTRGQEMFGTPAESINYYKQKHIYKVAEYYIYKNKIMNIPISLDAVEVYLFEDNTPKIEHIKNAIIEKPHYIGC